MKENCPSTFIIDITDSCNLHCIFCPEGQKYNEQPNKIMCLKDFIEIIQSILPFTKKIFLGNWAEPFLNPDIFEIVKYIKTCSKEIKILVTTNGNYFTERMARSLFECGCGIDILYISISGISQEIYAKYHKGGSIDKLLRTIEYITREKKRQQSKIPFIVINYLQFPFNYISFHKLRKFFRERFAADNLIEEIHQMRILYGVLLPCGSVLTLRQRRALYKNVDVSPIRLYLKYSWSKACKEPAIRSDGEVFPCCAVGYNPKNSLGNLHLHPFEKIWDSPKYLSFRDTLRNGKNSLCNNCCFYYPKHTIDFHTLSYHQIKANFWLIRAKLKELIFERLKYYVCQK